MTANKEAERGERLNIRFQMIRVNDITLKKRE